MILRSIAKTVQVLLVEEKRTDERHSSTVPLLFQSTSLRHHVSCIINVEIQDIRLFHRLSSFDAMFIQKFIYKLRKIDRRNDVAHQFRQ